MRTSTLRALVASLVVTLGAPLAAHAEDVKHAELGFSLGVPPNLVTEPPDPKDPDTVYLFHGPDDAQGQALVLSVQRLHGTLAQTPMKAEEMEGAEELPSAAWQGFKLQVWRVRDPSGTTVELVQVPLQREAVQLIAAGPKAREADVDALLRVALPGLRGTSSWTAAPAPRPPAPKPAGLAQNERAEKLGEGVGRLTMTAVILLGIVGGIGSVVRGLFRKKKK